MRRLLKGEAHRFFKDEINRKLSHAKVGTVSMANAGAENTNGSQVRRVARRTGMPVPALW